MFTMYLQEIHNAGAYTGKPAQTTQATPIYLNREGVPGATPPEQVAQGVTQRRELSRKYGGAGLVGYLRWIADNLALLFLLRFGLKLLGADPNNSFAAFIYNLTGFFLSPLARIVPATRLGTQGGASIEWSTLIAMAVFALLFYLAKLLPRTTTSRPQEPVAYPQKHAILSEGEREPSNETPESNPVLPRQSRGDKFHRGTPIPYKNNEPDQVERRATSTEDSSSSITGTGEEGPSLIKQQFGDYTMIRLIGQGGYASVYLGLHRHLQTYAALKLLNLCRTNEQVVRRFRSEAHILAHLRHPHIVRALDFGWEEGVPCIVMRFAPGGTLYDYFPAGLPQAVHSILPFVSQVASALQFVHHRGLVHCDVKPENMLLGPRDQLWLSDFGTAQSAAAASGTQIGASELVGTPMYLAPEQINGKPQPASDQYALAVVVYRWLCGRPPFLGSPLRVCLQQVETPPPHPRDLVPSLSPAVERVVLKALAKDPRQRFSHVQAFARALEQAGRAERGHTFPSPTTHSSQYRGFT